MTIRFRGFEEEPVKHTLDTSLVKRLWPFLRPYRASFALTLGILLVHFAVELGGTELLRIVFDGPVTDAVHGKPVASGTIVGLGIAYGVYVIAFAGLGYAFAQLSARNGQHVIRDVRQALFAHLMSLSPRFFERNPVGKLVTRVTSDVENLNELIATGVLATLFDLVKIVGISIFLFFLNWKLAVFALCATPVVIAISLRFRRFARDSYRKVRSSLGRQNGFTGEMIGGMRTTRVFGQEAGIAAHYAELNADTKQSWLATVFHFSLFFSVMDAVIRLAQVGILWFGGREILGDALSAGVFVQFWMLFNKLGDPIRELGEKYNVLQSAFSSTERIFQILDDRTCIEEKQGAVASPRGPARVEMRDVTFAYKAGHPVLHGVAFVAEPGQRIAIVGPTGAGKSTILALLSRLSDPGSGEVTLDSVPLGDLTLDSLRQRIAVVPQDVFLFTGSVLDNVRLFDPAIPQSRVEEALATALAADFVGRLEGGLQAQVQERGGTFSQGERQLLALARALAHDPDVLVLDEATANIDTRSEARIQEALRVVLKGRTAIVVAHRLSTVRDADQILVVVDGRIVERGRHDELVAKQGVYAKMLQRLAS